MMMKTTPTSSFVLTQSEFFQVSRNSPVAGLGSIVRAEIRSRRAPSRIATLQLSPRLLSAFQEVEQMRSRHVDGTKLFGDAHLDTEGLHKRSKAVPQFLVADTDLLRKCSA